ncbi:MAG: penicillin-binding transpeptidase domain-containing protein [bacterium]|nr:penicillin-binding transpeptidase domain-containing protein [bacterium]
MQPTKRLKAVSLLGLGFAVLLVFRLVFLQIWARETYTNLARSQHVKHTELKANRGRILDRHGRVLATNLETQSFFVNNVSELDSLRAIAVRFSRRAGGDESAILSRLRKTRPFVWLARQMVDGPSEAELPEGVGRIVEMGRRYPMGSLAAQVLGYTDPDNVGIEGIERAFEPLLRGRSGEMSSRVDARGHTLSALGAIRQLPEDGSDLVLTLDADYQSIAEEELARGVADFEADSGIAIVMDPSTGEILAMANVPLFDANAFSRVAPGVRRNRAVTDRFEPGSTFKVVAVAGALEAGLYSPEDSVFCEHGELKVAGGVIRDTHASGWLTVQEVLEESSNIGTIKIARALGAAGLYRMIKLFGFGDRTRSGLPGEVGVDLKHPSRWSKRSLETISIGQEIGVTALHVASAYAAIANGGMLMAPQIFLKAQRQDSLFSVGSARRIRRVMSPKGARMLTSILEGVVVRGTGSNARVPGFRVAGKTGTAQQVKEGYPGYDPDRYVSSFVGFLPVERPELLCLVAVDSPQKTRWASRVAAPVFRRIMQRILGLRKTSLRHRSVELAVDPEPAQGPLASLSGLTRASAGRVLERLGIAHRFEGAGDRVVGQVFQADRQEALLYTTHRGQPRQGPISVPDVRGVGLRQAVYRLTTAGLRVEISGSGRVIGQVPEPGEMARQGTVCRVVCKQEG